MCNEQPQHWDGTDLKITRDIPPLTVRQVVQEFATSVPIADDYSYLFHDIIAINHNN